MIKQTQGCKMTISDITFFFRLIYYFSWFLVSTYTTSGTFLFLDR